MAVRLLLLGILIFAFSHTLQAEKQAVTVAVFQNKPIVYDEEGAKGLYIDILNDIAQKENWQIEYITCSIKDCLKRVASGEIDLMTSLGKSPEREKSLAFSKEPVWTFWGTLYSNQQGVESIFDLEGKTVAVREGNKVTRALKSLMTEFGIQVKFLGFNTYEEAIEAFESKRASLIAVNNTYAVTLLSNVEVHRTPVVFNPFRAFFAVAKGSEQEHLLPILDRHVKGLRMQEDSIFDQFNQRWFPDPALQGSYKFYLYLSGGLLVILTLVFLLWRHFSVVSFNRLLQEKIEHENALSERLTIASDAAQIGIWEYILDGQVLIWDKWMFHLYGVDKTRFEGYRTWESRVHPEDLPVTLKKLTHSIRHGNDFDASFRICRDEGNVRWIRAFGRVVADQSGKPVKMVGINQDITLAKTYEIELEQRVHERTAEYQLAREEAEKASKAKTKFLANMSHELRTPMHAISGFSTLALRSMDNPVKLDRFLNNITISSTRLTRLIDNLLDISRIEVGKIQPSFSHQDVSSIVEACVAEVSSLLSDKKIKLALKVPEPVSCELDIQLISQVLVNLLSNAIKFSPEQSNIEIRVFQRVAVINHQRQQVLEITVADEGIGIPEDELGTVFDRFARSSKTIHENSGTGLGLSISYEIIKLHHGLISAESPIPGKDLGSMFHIILPLSQPLEQGDLIETIDDALKKHLEWRDMVADMCNSGDVPEEVSAIAIANDHACALGRWIDAGHAGLDYPDELVKSHRDFHLQAAECVAYCESGNLMRLESAKSQMMENSQKVSSILETLRDKKQSL